MLYILYTYVYIIQYDLYINTCMIKGNMCNSFQLKYMIISLNLLIDVKIIFIRESYQIPMHFV